ncbi:MAG: hypothetical protein WC805_01855 [Patescibacteria group bacterium]|jgi:hypothetical protein
MRKKRKPVQVDIKALQKLIKSVSHFSGNQKTQVRNISAATLAVVLIAGIFTFTPQLQNYFKSLPSQAFSIIEIGHLPTTSCADYQIVINPDMRTVLAGDETAYDITAVRQCGFSNPIILTTDLIGKDGIESAGFDSNVLVIGHDHTQLSVKTINGQSDIMHYFKVNGISFINGKLVLRSDMATLNIIKPEDFVIEVNPIAQIMGPDSSKVYMITLIRMNGFAGNVALSTDLFDNAQSNLKSVTIMPPILYGATLNATMMIESKSVTTDAIYPFIVSGDTADLNGLPAQREDTAMLEIIQ